MKKKFLHVLSLLVAFILGVMVTYISMTKQQMDAVLQAKVTNTKPQVINHQATSIDVDSQIEQLPALNNTNTVVSQNKPANVSKPTNEQQSVSINDYSEAEAKAIINNMPNYMLEQYIDKFMAKGVSEQIQDSRRFAERAIEELYTTNDTQALDGEVRLALTNLMPDASINTDTINKNATLYAHLDTFGKTPQSPYVFIKWVDNATGQILLFEKKDVVANSNQNWVSFSPYDGWHTGSYDIRFYQFTSELQPIAQLTYQIHEVVE